MTTATATPFFTDLASAGETAPEWVELFPVGPNLTARDGRSWTLDPAIVVKAFAANNGPLAIDYEHAQAHRAPNGEEAPAAGWITAVEERAGAVWGKVEWTKAAARKIVEREYRFLSPDFDYSPNPGHLIVRLNGAGLVNRPALVMTALSRELSNQKERPMLKAIAAALGLAEDADETAILAAIGKGETGRKALCAKLKIDEASDATAIAAALDKLNTDTETALAAAKASPAAGDVAALTAQLTDTRTALAALQKKDADREVEAALDQAAAEGKITPASRESYRAMCAAEGGLDRFKALAATLPKICEPTNLDRQPPGTTNGGDNADPIALAALARKHQDDQAAVGIIISISQAVEHVKAEGK